MDCTLQPLYIAIVCIFFCKVVTINKSYGTLPTTPSPSDAAKSVQQPLGVFGYHPGNSDKTSKRSATNGIQEAQLIAIMLCTTLGGFFILFHIFIAIIIGKCYRPDNIHQIEDEEMEVQRIAENSNSELFMG